jgi:hypothetical protein
MTERRRIAAIVLLFLIGFGLVALASALGSAWPLVMTPLPYAAIAWIVVRAGDEAAPSPGEEGTPATGLERGADGDLGLPTGA